jgi:ABC-type branched-subunit amino acid transport system ATPase component
MTPLLSVRNVRKRFGAVSVLADVSLDVEAGRVQALIGPNGAGKTTLLNVMSGYLAQDAGSVGLRGQSIDGWSASRRVGAGMARTFQLVQLFGRMTAAENVMCAFHLHHPHSMIRAIVRGRAFLSEERRLREGAEALLARLGLAGHADEAAGLLPFGLQRRLELARALATRPALLLLDEPCAGLDGTEVRELGQVLKELAAEGIALLLVEHHMPFVLGIAERVAVLDAGEIIAEGPPDEIRGNRRVIEAYLGESEHAAA